MALVSTRIFWKIATFLVVGLALTFMTSVRGVDASDDQTINSLCCGVSPGDVVAFSNNCNAGPDYKRCGRVHSVRMKKELVWCFAHADGSFCSKDKKIAQDMHASACKNREL